MAENKFKPIGLEKVKEIMNNPNYEEWDEYSIYCDICGKEYPTGKEGWLKDNDDTNIQICDICYDKIKLEDKN